MKKKVILIVADAMLIGSLAAQVVKAADFKLIDIKAPQTSVGTFIDAKSGSSAAGGLVALVTHKDRLDNTMLAALARGWVPLTIGGTLGQGLGGPSLAMGTGINLFPAAQASLYGLVNAVSGSDQLTGLKVALAASPTTACIFIGPQESLVVRSLNRMGTKLTWFFGASITWE